jgi:hypothetical protein
MAIRIFSFVIANSLREPIEYMPIEETYSPAVHRIIAAIRNRAIYPDEPIKPPPEVIMQWANPPADLVANAASQLKKLQKAADVKKGKCYTVLIPYNVTDTSIYL